MNFRIYNLNFNMYKFTSTLILVANALAQRIGTKDWLTYDGMIGKHSAGGV
jgi:hypothetical protein